MAVYNEKLQRELDLFLHDPTNTTEFPCKNGACPANTIITLNKWIDQIADSPWSLMNYASVGFLCISGESLIANSPVGSRAISPSLLYIFEDPPWTLCRIGIFSGCLWSFINNSILFFCSSALYFNSSVLSVSIPLVNDLASPAWEGLLFVGVFDHYAYVCFCVFGFQQVAVSL